MKQLVIGITGTNGSGKGVAVDYLISRHEFAHYSVSDYLKEELAKSGDPPTRVNLINIGNLLRTRKGGDFIVSSLYKKALKSGKHAVIESIRSPIEAEFILNNNDVLVGVDADFKTRFNRIKKRRSEKDSVTLNEFRKQEKLEMNNSDPNLQNIYKCLEMSDYLLKNNGSLESFYEEVDKIIKKIS